MQTFTKGIHLLLMVSLFISVISFPSVIRAEEHSESNFRDQELLQTMIDQGIIIGDGNGDYALDRSITRAEWLTILKRIIDKQNIRLFKPSIPLKKYTDLDQHWAKEEVLFWIEHGVIYGDTSGSLRLDEPITIAELLVIFDRLNQDQHVISDHGAEPLMYADHWAYPSLNRLYEKGWVRFDQPLWEQELRLDRLAMRGEGLLLLAPLYEQKDETQSHTQLSEIKRLLDQPIDVDGDGLLDFSFRLNNATYQLEAVSVSEDVYNHLHQKDWLYDVRELDETVGQLRFQLKQVKEQDLVYFIRYTPLKNQKDPFSLDLIYYGQGILAGRTPISAIGEDKLPYDWEQLTINDAIDLPRSSLYLQGESVEMRISGTDTFSDLGYSVRDYQEIDQTRSFVYKSNEGYHFTFTFTNELDHYSETWGILAGLGLLYWERSTFDSFVLRDDISINRKLSLEGLFYRTPNNYKPRSSYSYYLNPANIMGVRAISSLQKEKSKGRYIDDLVILLGHMAVDQQNDKGFWPTQPKSEWLEKEYEIGYNYYDNRRNADNVTFLLLVYQHYPDERIKLALEHHLDYLYKVLEEHSVRTSEYGLLFTDYIGDDQSEMSHIALNHQLSVINFLFDWHIKMKDEKAKDYAFRMITGIEDTENLWIKENDDLYYALYADLTPHHYLDYLDLTLSDLKITQNYLSRILGRSNDHLQNLIDSKQQWLEKRLNPPPPVEDISNPL